MHNKGGGMRLGMGVAMSTGVWGTGVDPPAGSRGAKSPRSRRILKVVTCKFYAFLAVQVIHTQYMKSKH